jgi:lipoteichoic acid synthase
MSLLDRRDWLYLLSLLIPLVAYDLALKIVGLASEYPDSGVWDTLRLLRSELLFDAGYVLVWIGLFAVARRGIPRRVVLVLLHASAILVVVIATVAYQYFRSTGTVLDYSVVAYLPGQTGRSPGCCLQQRADWRLARTLGGAPLRIAWPSASNESPPFYQGFRGLHWPSG